jgi:hypothetical protein
MIASAVGLLGSVGAGAFAISLFAGWCYWMWMAIKLSSFGMFFVGLFPLFQIVSAPVGLWSLLFGPPSWLINFFA